MKSNDRNVSMRAKPNHAEDKSSRSTRTWDALKLAMMLSCAALLGSVAHAQQSFEKLAGVWRIEKPLHTARTIDGKEPPLKAEALKKYREHIAARKQGDTSFDSATWCSSVGMPRIMFIDSPFEIMVQPPYVAFMHEWNWWARVVYLEGALATEPAPGAVSAPTSGGRMLDPSAARDLPGPMGLSQGQWDGDTLVVETTHLIDLTLIDSAGLPHSDNLKLTERLRLRSPNVLENRIRVEDPDVFTQPWETLVTYRRQRNTQLQEDVCLDRIQNGSPAVKG